MVEPLAAVAAAIDRLAAETGDSSGLDTLLELARVAKTVVPPASQWA